VPPSDAFASSSFMGSREEQARRKYLDIKGLCCKVENLSKDALKSLPSKPCFLQRPGVINLSTKSYLPPEV
ncbi:MAG: hypothetical protein QW505_04365, partial [Thermoplasmata archaeon]